MVLHTADIRIVSVDSHHGVRRAVQKGDLCMSEFRQVVDRKIDALKAVGADIGYVWIFRDIIVEEYRGDGGGLHLSHPGIFQGEADQKTAVEPILDHISVVGIARLQHGRDGRDCDLPVVAHCCLLEAKYDVKSEIPRLFVLHIFDKHA